MNFPDFDRIQNEPKGSSAGAKLLKGILLILILALAAAAVAACVLYTEYVTQEDGAWIVDLTGREVSREHIEFLEDTFPNIVVRRTVDLGGIKIDNDTHSLTLTDAQGVTAESLINAAEQLPAITSLNLTGLSLSVNQYERLREAYPDAKITWLVPLGSGRIEPDTEALQLGTMEELREVLSMLNYLPMLHDIDMTGAYLTAADRAELALCRDAYGMDIIWNVTVAGTVYPWDTDSVTLSGSQVTDLTALQELTMLRELTLDGIGTGDLSPLASVTTLESITVRNMDVDDVSVLGSMYWLGSFFVKNTNITYAQLGSLQDQLPDCIIMMLE